MTKTTNYISSHELIRLIEQFRTAAKLSIGLSSTSIQQLSISVKRLITDIAACLSPTLTCEEIEKSGFEAGRHYGFVTNSVQCKLDMSFALLKSIRQIVRASFTPANAFAIPGLKELSDTDNISQVITSFFDGFFLGLTRELNHLTILPYHRKLREANRFILLEKRRYYSIFNRMAEPAFILDNNMRLVESNAAFNKLFQLSGKGHIGKFCYEVIGAEVLSKWPFSRSQEPKTSYSGIETVITVKGIQKNVIISGAFLGEINSELSGSIVIIQDVTQRISTEKALRESEAKYRSLIENVPDVTWSIDQDGRLEYISPNVENLTGFNPKEMKGDFWFNRIHPSDIDYVRNKFGHYFSSQLPTGTLLRGLFDTANISTEYDQQNQSNEPYDVRYRFQRKDGHWVWFHDHALVIYKRENKWLTDGVTRDITELKKAEVELEKHHFKLSEMVDERTAELQESNRHLVREIGIRKQAEQDLIQLAAKLEISNKELEQFAHVVSHDLKEPLVLITAFTERLQKFYSKNLDDKGDEYLKRILASSKRMGQLIEGLLDLSKLSSSDRPFEEIDLTDVIKEVIQELEERINECNADIQFGELGVMGGDKMQIRQLFQNIISNAIKYRKADHNPMVVVESCVLDGDYIEITINDNGIGFDQHNVDRIFKPLQRLHAGKEYDGTGMGLATCQKIVLRHGGSITAKSKPGTGSIFVVRLPVKASS